MEEATFARPKDQQAVEITVQGRKFLAVNDTTFEQDIYIMQLLEESGLQKLAAEFDITKDDISDVSTKVIVTAFSTGKLFELVAASVEEIGVVWSVEQAKLNAIFFRQLTDPQDKAALKSSIVAVILGFFVSGLLSSKSSEFSSTIARGIKLESIVPSSVSGEPNGGNTTSETGILSSES